MQIEVSQKRSENLEIIRPESLFMFHFCKAREIVKKHLDKEKSAQALGAVIVGR